MSEKKTTPVTPAKATVAAKKPVNKQEFIRRKLNVLNSKDGVMYERAALHVVEVNAKRGAK